MQNFSIPHEAELAWARYRDSLPKVTEGKRIRSKPMPKPSFVAGFRAASVEFEDVLVMRDNYKNLQLHSLELQARLIESQQEVEALKASLQDLLSQKGR